MKLDGLLSTQPASGKFCCSTYQDNILRHFLLHATNLLVFSSFAYKADGNNKCPASNCRYPNIKVTQRFQKLIEIDPCGGNDTLDGGCEYNDRCLDNAGNDPGSDGIPTPDRCPCDLDFLFTLDFASQDGCDSLCDEDFYNKPVVPIDTTGTPVLSWSDVLWSDPSTLCPDAILLAAPFCSDFVPIVGGGACVDPQIDGEDLYSSDQKGNLPFVVGFCSGILAAIGPLFPNELCVRFSLYPWSHLNADPI